MPNFFKQLGDGLGGFLLNTSKELSGQTNTEAYNKQIEQQAAVNAQIIQLEKERQELLNSPEYQKQKNIKIIAAVVILFVCLGLAFFIVRKNA